MPSPSSGSPPSSPAAAAAASKRRSRPPSGGSLTWPWWRRYPTQGYVVPRLRPSPGVTSSAGRTASGRFTVLRSKTDVEAQGVVAAITPAAIWALDSVLKGNGRCRWFTVNVVNGLP